MFVIIDTITGEIAEQTVAQLSFNNSPIILDFNYLFRQKAA
jgi:hypothetical protein